MKPISNSYKTLFGAILLAGAATFGIVKCSNSARKSNVDLTTCHNVDMCGNVMKIQDGVSLELNSKIYLMNNGQLLVFDKTDRTWNDAQGKIDNIYNYQRDTFIDIAKTTEEMDDTLVLSENDIQHLQNNPRKLNFYKNYRSYTDAQSSGEKYRQVKDTKGNSIVMSAGEDSYYVYHSTPRLKVSYNQNKDEVLK